MDYPVEFVQNPGGNLALSGLPGYSSTPARRGMPGFGLSYARLGEVGIQAAGVAGEICFGCDVTILSIGVFTRKWMFPYQGHGSWRGRVTDFLRNGSLGGNIGGVTAISRGLLCFGTFSRFRRCFRAGPMILGANWIIPWEQGLMSMDGLLALWNGMEDRLTWGVPCGSNSSKFARRTVFLTLAWPCRSRLGWAACLQKGRME